MEVTGGISELDVSLVDRNGSPLFLFRLCVALIVLVWALFTHTRLELLSTWETGPDHPWPRRIP